MVNSVPMMISGPPPMLAATAAFGRMSSQLSASTRILTPVCSTNFLVLTDKTVELRLDELFPSAAL